jgi:hypothetical protein
VSKELVPSRVGLVECVLMCSQCVFTAVSKELVPSRVGLVEASIQNHIDMQKKTNSKLEMLKKKVSEHVNKRTHSICI